MYLLPKSVAPLQAYHNDMNNPSCVLTVSERVHMHLKKIPRGRRH
jgi:hypothetical protein